MGAGATQAEVNYLDAAKVNLLMRDNDFGEGVSTGVLKRLGRKGKPYSTDKGVDIEKLISLLTGSGLSSHIALADELRESYFEEICKRLEDSQIIENPELATALLEMHMNPFFRKKVETLSGVITTNHDGLLQRASQVTFGALNTGFQFTSSDFSFKRRFPMILQLHGSFTWGFATPLCINALCKGSTYSQNTSWIPPTVTKESKTYPFNKLMGMAYELLSKKCDVLRVIGSSLTQNDWNILALIFNAQRHRENLGRSSFVIELIMPQRIAKNLETECAYFKNILSIGSLTDGQFAEYKDWEEDDPPPDSELSNPFFYWLREKINYHKRNKDFGSTVLAGAVARVSGGVA